MKEIKKIIMKYPLASILATIALSVPCSIELLLTNWREVLDNGLFMIIGISIIFSITSICLWGIAYLISIPIIKIFENDNEIYPNWELGIGIASLSFIIWSFTCLGICYYKNLGFKWFIFLTYIIPLYRIVFLFIQLFYLKILRK